MNLWRDWITTGFQELLLYNIIIVVIVCGKAHRINCRRDLFTCMHVSTWSCKSKQFSGYIVSVNNLCVVSKRITFFLCCGYNSINQVIIDLSSNLSVVPKHWLQHIRFSNILNHCFIFVKTVIKNVLVTWRLIKYLNKYPIKYIFCGSTEIFGY